MPSGKCRTSEDCGIPGSECSMADASRHCFCSNGTEPDVCENLGTCLLNRCSLCRECLRHVASFTTNVMNDAADAVMEKWPAFCTPELGVDKQLCSNIQTTIGMTQRGNFGRRAAPLCRYLGRCPYLDQIGNCTLSYSLSADKVVSGTLDFCTVEGLTGNGTMLPDTFRQSDFAMTKPCLTDWDCGNPTDAMCDFQSEGKETCICSDGMMDSCFRAGSCVRTPAKICSDCLGEFTAFAAAHFNETNAARLSEAVNATCLQSRPAEVCNPVAERIARAVNSGLRAGGICTMLPDCDPTTLPSSALLVYPGLVPGSMMYGRPQHLDLCTVEGLVGGMQVPGFTAAPAGGITPGYCVTSSDCTAVWGSNY